MTTQLTTTKTFDENKIIFSKSQESKIPGQDVLTYQRIMISTEYPDGTSGPLIIPMNDLFSFGVSENKSMDGKSLTGYSLSLCLHARDGATEEEKKTEEIINRIVAATKAHMLKPETKKETKQFELVESDLRKTDPIYRKKVEGVIVEGNSPVLYPKLVAFRDKKTNDMIVKTVFYKSGSFEPNGEPTVLDLKDVLGQMCHVTAAVKFESIYIGSGKIRLQIKVPEADVRLSSASAQPLLRRKRVGGLQATEKSLNTDAPTPVTATTELVLSDDESITA